MQVVRICSSVIYGMEKGFFSPLPMEKGAAVPGKGVVQGRRRPGRRITDREDAEATAPPPLRPRRPHPCSQASGEL